MAGLCSVKKEYRSPSPPLSATARSTVQDRDLPTANVKDELCDGKPLNLLSPPFPLSASMCSSADSKADPKVEVDASSTPSKSESPAPPLSTSAGPVSSTSISPPPLPPPPPQLRSFLLTNTCKSSSRSTPQLISDLPFARTEALSTFTEICDNIYQFKSLGRSREEFESMTCDCTYEHDIPGGTCGPYSDCINRLTQVECLEDDCRGRGYCQNQRFQKKQHASIEIVQTEKKGYGLRAETDLAKDTFIYEYLGEVINPISFRKRMRAYADEGIEHFYFMMLQKDEFIDATKFGGIGRFANHSCNPNCYVAKWTIGSQVRMGIFAKRDIMRHEELTFNYNVDRYGHQAQECYCGEPNCVGYIGGKTQTDVATLDDLYLDALGITDECDLMALKGTKKKRGKKIDDPDFMPAMKAIVEKDVPMVVQAIRQTQNRKVLLKLLTRIKITEDQAALRQIMRLRGYSLMNNVLSDNLSDLELISLALQCLSRWPLVNRNKVEDSKIVVPVRECAALTDEQVARIAQRLLDHWESLPLYSRIPKRAITEGEEKEVVLSTSYDRFNGEPPPSKSLMSERLEGLDGLEYLPKPPFWQHPPPRLPTPPLQQAPSYSAQVSRAKIQAIIMSATEAAAEEAAALAALAKAKAVEESAADKVVARKGRSTKKHLSTEEKQALKDKRLLKLVGAVVVKCMSKHSKAMSHDQFKKHAKDLTHIIAEKEKKSSSFREGRLESLSDEKVAKIKKFTKEYIAKVLARLEKANKRARPPSSATTQATPSTSTDTPAWEAGVTTRSDAVPMSVEEAMDIHFDSDEEMDGTEENRNSVVDDHVMSDEEDMSMTCHNVGLTDAMGDEIARTKLDSLDLPGSAAQTSDPRRRPPADVPS